MHPPIMSCTALDSLGAAHGWSGILYALMRWAQAVQAPPAAGLAARLAELSACARPAEAGIRWPIRLAQTPGDDRFQHMSGWCNGGAGHVDTWLLAHALFGDAAFLDLAVRSAAQAFADSLRQSAPSLCCGMAGVAFALLGLHRVTRDPLWLEYSHRLAETAVAEVGSLRLPQTSLFQGAAGLAILAACLSQPASAQMPIFGRET
jgi:serine/threonine-protein kinase